MMTKEEFENLDGNIKIHKVQEALVWFRFMTSARFPFAGIASREKSEVIEIILEKYIAKEAEEKSV